MGVKQGCIMSQLLFSVAIDWVMRKSTENEQTGIKWIDNSVLEDLDYADDLALLSANHTDAQSKLDSLQHYSNQIGLKINTSKTHILDFTTSNDDIKIQNVPLLKVNNFTYLGTNLILDGDTSKEILHRIALAAGAFNKLRNIWKSNTLRNTTKLRLFNSNIIPILLYGWESWKATKATDKRLNTFENKCLRIILNVKWSDFKSNTTIREESKQTYIASFIRQRRWNYTGHVLRMNSLRIPHQSLNWVPSGVRRRGRPRETLRRTINREGMSMNLNNTQELKDLATQRQKWKAMVSALCAAYGPGGT